MKFFKYDEKVLSVIIDKCTYQELIRFTKYINDVAPGQINIKKISSTRKAALVDYLTKLLLEDKNILSISQKLLSTELSAYLYITIVWQSITLKTSAVSSEFNFNFPAIRGGNYGVNQEYLNGTLSLIIRATRISGGYYYTDNMDVLSVSKSLIYKIQLYK